MTTATIAMEMQDGTIREVYLSSDGYVDHTGVILLQNYTNPSVVRELIDRGSIYSLQPSLDETDFFGDEDSDNADINCSSYGSWDEYFNSNGGLFYNYIMRNDGNW